ncbi:MAG: PhoH family protein [Clostridiales bacterium]|nr:PhoH family protein [Clostridiales bacterium]
MAQRIVAVNADKIPALFGVVDENIELLGRQYGVDIKLRGGSLEISGADGDAERAARVTEKLFELAERGVEITKEKVRAGIDLEAAGRLDEMLSLSTDAVAVTNRGKLVKCRTLGQREYVDAVRKNTVTLAVGPAGTGKTYLSVAMAATAFKNNEVEKIVLTRPAVEAGEKLGFLPGDLQEKVDPYLRPLYDALADMFGAEAYQRLIEKQVIEVAPLAFMRGRTLANAFIILDEAQNTTDEQMKMFLTRFGTGSKVVANGDITQVDLPPNKTSGLERALRVLSSVKRIGIVRLTDKDVVRHELIADIIRAYEKNS